MFRTVLVLLDGSREAEIAVPYAADEARRHGSALVLLRVVPRPELAPSHVPHGGPTPAVPRWSAAELAAAVRTAAAYLDDVIRRHDLDPVPEVVTPVGDPYLRLLAELDHRPQPLVVLAMEDAADSSAQLLNATAERVLLAGSVPVLRVRGAPAPPLIDAQDLGMTTAWS